MKYISTRGEAPVLGFEDALLAGLASDGGLYVPESWPRLSEAMIAGFAEKSFAEIAIDVLHPFMADDVPRERLAEMVHEAYTGFEHDDVTPLTDLGDGHYFLELYHGPTLAFKDVAMQLLARLMDDALVRRGERATIVGATSGDTGGAAIEAFRARDAVDVFILFPDGRVSDVQRKQMTTPPEANGVIRVTMAVAEECIQKKAVVYDGDGDQHYDTISAFIKSIRGSDPDAALYWLAKMIHAGEDPRFITRRLMISAAEDIGLADPMALVLSTSAHQAAEFIGWPEARIPIAEATVYLATAHKSNSAYTAINSALEEVKTGRTIPVPKHLRDSHYAGAKRLGNGEEYKYAHAYDDHFVVQDYLGVDIRFYDPTEQGVEKKIKDRVLNWRSLQKKAKQDGNPKS